MKITYKEVKYIYNGVQKRSNIWISVKTAPVSLENACKALNRDYLKRGSNGLQHLVEVLEEENRIEKKRYQKTLDDLVMELDEI